MPDANAVNRPERDPERDVERGDPYEGFRSSISFEELARLQGVKPVEKMEDLMPDWPEGEWDGEEDFDALRAQMRLDEIEIMRRNLAETPPTGKDPAEDYETFEREQWEQEVAVWDREHGDAPDENKRT